MRTALVLLFGAALVCPAAAAPSYETIYQFTDGHSGCLPNAGLTKGPHGEFYGVASSCGNQKLYGGTVFMLTPPSKNTTAWTEHTLWRFKAADGEQPDGALLLGHDGELYGTTYGGFGDHTLFGSVFKLTNKAGRWTLQQIWAFGVHNVGKDGGEPTSGLVEDESGALYGTTTLAGKNRQGEGFGTIFKLTPPAEGSAWTYDELCYFSGRRDGGTTPFSTLYRAADGVLYGTDAFGGASGDGAVFTVTPPGAGQTEWVKKDVYDFSPPDATPFSGLVPGKDGALYGMTSGYQAGDAGTIFRVEPPTNVDTRWREQTLYQFSGLDGAFPIGNLTPDGGGGFYGAAFMGGAYDEGTLFHVQPNADGHLPWAFTKLHAFKFILKGTHNIQPNGGLVMDRSGALLGTTFQDLRYFAGSVFRVVPRQ
jgi:hypothetical protein